MSVAVGLGLMEFPFAGAKDYWRWVDLCEAGGVDSLWQTDRLVSREPMLECMTAMAALAGRTRRIKFGMNVVSLALRDPVLVAKQCATIDVLSQGRLLPAFGIGSPRAPEWAALHVDTRTRGRKTDEGLEIMRRLWREDSVDFTGEHYRLTGATISPKPVQADLPMWIGGGVRGRDPAHGTRRYRLAGRTARRRRRPRASSPPSRLPLPRPAAASTTTTTARASPSISGGRRSPRCSGRWRPTPSAPATTLPGYFAVGDAGVIVERIAEYVAAGVSKFVLRPVGRAARRCWPRPASSSSRCCRRWHPAGQDGPRPPRSSRKRRHSREAKRFPDGLRPPARQPAAWIFEVEVPNRDPQAHSKPRAGACPRDARPAAVVLAGSRPFRPAARRSSHPAASAGMQTRAAHRHWPTDDWPSRGFLPARLA